MKNRRLNHIDCFSGPGGICTGFAAAHINTIAAIEKVESCVQTYSANHPNVNVIHKDIREVSEEDIKKAIGDNVIDLITSGMPCETFSTAGSKSRSGYDYRQLLYSEGIRIAKIVNAPMILFENVPAILTKKVEKNGTRLIVEDIIQELKENGYTYTCQGVLKAIDFGVPQTRERFFLLATNNPNYKLELPKPICETPITVEDVFVGLPLMEANDKNMFTQYVDGDSEYTKLLKNSAFWGIKDNGNTLTYFNSPKHRETTIERFKLIKQGESLVDIFKKHTQQELEQLQARKIITKKWFIQRNKRLEWDKPSKTITSHCLDELIHPVLNRALSVRECARLQSFPDSYVFKGPYIVPHLSKEQDMYEQIGDAVPPLLAYHWGIKIKEIMGF